MVPEHDEVAGKQLLVDVEDGLGGGLGGGLGEVLGVDGYVHVPLLVRHSPLFDQFTVKTDVDNNELALDSALL